MRARLSAVGFAIFTVIIAFASGALAGISEARAMKDAKISLVDAIQSAESHTGGKAYEASIDDDSFSLDYEVSVLKDDRIYDVRVDASSGDVTGVREDRDD